MTDCFWDGQVLELSLQKRSNLPEALLEILTHGTNSEYLTALADLAFDSSWTELIFATYEPLFIDISGRWTLQCTTDPSLSLRVVAILSRLLPFCPRLSTHIQEIISMGNVNTLPSAGDSASGMMPPHLSSAELTQLLMTQLRLLDFDQHIFSSFVFPIQIHALLSHEDRHIRYLACRIISLYFHFTDKAAATHVERYCDDGPMFGIFEGIDIDFRFLDSWEIHRRRTIGALLKNCRASRTKGQCLRQITATDLCSRSIDFAGYIATSCGPSVFRHVSMVLSPTARRNLRKVAELICGDRPALIVGAPGSGKTVLIEEIAAYLGQSSKMLTLHLNAQTDAKLLIGLYTASSETGAFKWQPGVLTTAVLEGRWVLIEDLDRAPSELVSVLLSLLDTRELMVPNLGGTIRAAPGFKLIATIQTKTNDRESEGFLPEFLGSRHWEKGLLDQYTRLDLELIVSALFPLLRSLQDRILRMFNTVKNFSQSMKIRQAGLRIIGLQELLRFCARCFDLTRSSDVTREIDAVPSSLIAHVFLEAIDSFCGHIPPGSTKDQMTDLIGRELHVSPENVRFYVYLRVPNLELRARSIKYGRVELPLRRSGLNRMVKKQRAKRPFARTNHALKYIESIAAAVHAKYPCLLVGETGTGKTTMVQELASMIGQKLFVVNLSQQSEVGDLLGGYKPVTLKALATPIRDEFDVLFEETLSSKKNEKFVSSLQRNLKKGTWSKVLKLWQEASKTASTTLMNKIEPESNPSKKRKINPDGYEKLQRRWSQLDSEIRVFAKHLNSGSKGFVFSFVEGNLVKAVRNGDWILLDEINLASSDTLESLADLLSSGIHKTPSILLSETGQIKRIEAHEDFRIFAAMNPATDVGKRELPSSIRSRFSEYFISSCEGDMESLLQICSVYLGNHIHSDNRVAHDVASLYQSIRSLETENRLVDGASQKPHFTIRTLTRTLTYAMDIIGTYGLRRSLYEGVCMNFLTLLDRLSISLVSPLIYQHLLASQKSIRSILHQIPRCPGDVAQYVQFRHYWMAKGPFPVVEQPEYIITPFVEANLLNLVRATSTRRYPILLQGPTSSGKTSMIEYLAKMSGNKFVRINNHEHTDLQEYLGTYVSKAEGLQFEDGVLVRALREGHWIVLDELNLAPTDILEALNRLLDDNRELLVPETQEVIRPHPDFMLFATQNPPGLYGGRKYLSRAFRNRFLELHFGDIPENELEIILRERSQIAPSYCTKIVEVYKKLSILRQTNRLFELKNSFATLRDLFRWAFRDADTVEQLAINGFMLLGERVRNPAERHAVQTIIEEVMRVRIDTSRLYRLDDGQSNQIKQSGSLSSTISMTKAMSRLYILVATALKNKEPVLLIGNAGCGKTTICQLIAEVSKTKLHILNAHQNTETGDIIGALRPARNRQQARSELQILLQQLYEDTSQKMLGSTMELDNLLQWYTSLPESTQSRLSSELRSQIDDLLTRSKTLFEWADGILVTAMRSGHYFLLDEISLADDSVLERLNSVLESSRTLLLAEKGAADALVVAHSGFQFLATMNPGGDYGKKELSPALRNRFTEIWVSELNDDEDLLKIVKSKLNDPLQRFSEPIVVFAKWFEKNCRESEDAVSLRATLAWIDFLNLPSISNVDVRLVHGAAMVYIDGIGADPAAKIYIPPDDVKVKRKACLDQLQDLFEIPAHDIYFAKPQVSIVDCTLSIGAFKIVAKRPIIQDSRFHLSASTTVNNTLRVIRSLQISKPIILEGSPGVGKTSLIEAVARTVGMPLTRINLSEQSDLMDLFGSDVPVDNGSVGQFEWRDAPFLTAMQKGEWVLLDEMNLASQSVLEGLNACLDHRGQVFIPELDRSFTKHPNFTLFAAQNPHSQGSGRKGLPASFVNRFTVVFAESLNKEDMIQILAGVFPHLKTEIAQTLASYISALNLFTSGPSAPVTAGGPWEFNLRDLLRWTALIEKQDSVLNAAAPDDFESMLVLGRLRTSEDRSAVSKQISPLFSNARRSKVHYSNFGTNFIQCGLGLWQKTWTSNITMQLSDHRDYTVLESVMITVEQNWPCLLVGTSGSGKSRLIRGLASAYGANISTLPLNSEMDTMDIIGGYEQVDYSRHVKALLQDAKVQIKLLWAKSCSNESEFQLAIIWHLLSQQSTDIALIAHNLQNLATYGHLCLKKLADKLLNIFQKANQNIEARFEWIDGALVEAMQRGDWFILDNANLCNASVLDRLNALLEPDGILSLNEYRLEDGSPRTITRHPKFRLFLTMDPRYGELSRAMRNRCVELYLFPDNSSPNEQYVNNSFVSQPVLEFLRKFDWNKLSASEAQEIMMVGLSRFSIANHSNFDLWCNQISKGLYDLDPKVYRLLGHVQRIFVVSYGKSSIIQALQDIHVDYLKLSGSTSSEIRSTLLEQSIDPTANTALVNLMQKNNTINHLKSFEELSYARLKLARLQQQLSDIQTNLGRDSPHHLTQLEKSMVIHTDRRFAKEVTAPIALLFSMMISSLESYLDVELLPKPQSILGVTHLISYLQDLCDFMNCTPFDEGLFFAYIRRGWRLYESQRRSEKEVPGLEMFKHHLSMFGTINAIQAMESFWIHFKPPIPKSLDDLMLSFELEDLDRRLEAVLWKSQAGIYTIVKFKALLRDGFQHSRSRNLSELTGKVQEEELSKALEPQVMRPYFQDVFEVIRQYVYLTSDVADHDDLANLSVLGGHAIYQPGYHKTIHPNKTTLMEVSSITGNIESSVYLGAVSGNLPSILMRKIDGIPLISLRHYFRLQEELPILCRYISTYSSSIITDIYRSLRRLLRAFMLEVISAHQHLLTPDDFEILLVYLCDSGATKQNVQQSHPPQFSPVIDDNSQPQCAILLRKVQHALKLIEESSHANKDQHEALSTLGSAWIEFSLTCLELYIPDHPFDPALGPRIAYQAWHKNTSELATEIFALAQYEIVMIGQPTEFRQQLLGEKVQSLGPEPNNLSIARPQKSKIVEVHAEFQNIQRTVIQPFQTEQLINLLGNSKQVSEIRRHVALNISRLQSHREYHDITVPAARFLQTLDVGLALKTYHRSREIVSCQGSYFAGPKSGLFGLDVKQILQTLPHRSLVNGPKSLDHRYIRLSCIALDHHVQVGSSENSALIILDAFRQFYKEWKTRLSEEQSESKARASLYHFKGSEDVTTIEAVELDLLFPTYEAEGAISTGNPRKVLPSVLAQTLADVQAAIFSESIQDGFQMLDYLSLVFESLVVAVPASSTACYPFAAVDLLPSVIPHLDREQRYHSKQNLGPIINDFYNQPNLVEASRLVVLARNIRLRFKEIQDSWPEHATLGHVLQVVEDILDSKINDPLAKLITITETLHGFVYEWQTVASREFSAIHLYDELTRLLIDWRRSELSTWSHLLDQEDRKHVREAQSWWFIAYEAILHPVTTTNLSIDEVQDFAVQLSFELHNFVKTANLGQFATRMEILTTFQHQVVALSKDMPVISPIAETLAITVDYFKRWQSKIESEIQQQRNSLDARMKDIILLSSWKDTNISALKASARRSHNSLFKIIKKYRDMLAGPIDTLLNDPPASKGQSDRSAYSIAISKRYTEVSVSLASDYLDSVGIMRFPGRLADPVKIASLMNVVGQMTEKQFDPVLYLESVNDSLISSIKSLQQETPPILTEDNKMIVKHLKTQKRNLLADILKELKKMGIRSNLNAKALDAQDSIPKIFATSACEPRLSMAIQDLYVFLDNVIDIRQKVRKPSNDLSPSDIHRGTGFIEGLLFQIYHQRRALCSAFKELDACDTFLGLLHKIWQPSQYSLCIASGKYSSTKQLGGRLRWSAAILNTAKLIVDMLASMGQLDYVLASDRLVSYETQILALVSDVDQLPDLSAAGIMTSVQVENLIHLNQTLQIICFEIQGLMKEYPNLQIVLIHVLPWLDLKNSFDQLVLPIRDLERFPATEPVPSVSEPLISSELDIIVKKMLVGLQNFRSIVESMPNTNEDPAWLLNYSDSLTKMSRSLQISKIVAILQSSLLSSISPEEQRIQTMSAAGALIMPPLEEYRNCFAAVLNKQITLHTSICRLANTLSTSFSQIVTQGFCAPADEKKTEQENGQTEGVGLGEGEGAQDISKDIEDNEDLSELAQGAQKDKVEQSDDGIGKEDDAVDLGEEDLEGELDSRGEERGSEDEDGNDSEGAQDDISNEVGSVDDLDPSALDEKLWEEEDDKLRREREGKASSRKEGEETIPDVENNEALDTISNAENGDADLEEHPLDLNEKDQLDPHISEEENLELPEDMQIGGQQNSESEIEDLKDLDELSDEGTFNENDREEASENEVDDKGEVEEDNQITSSNSVDMEEAEAHENENERNEITPSEPEENTVLESNPEATANMADENTEDVQRGTGVQADQVEHVDDEAEGDARNIDASTSKSRAKDSNTAKTVASTGDETESEPTKGSDGNQVEEIRPQRTLEPPKVFRKLGEALEQWQRTQQIQEASEDQRTQSDEQTLDVQHLLDDDDKPDAQVLGLATENEVHALSKDELDKEIDGEPRETEHKIDSVDQEEDVEMGDNNVDDDVVDRAPTDTFIGARDIASLQQERSGIEDEEHHHGKESEDNIEEIDNELSGVRITITTPPDISLDQARKLWQQCESTTRELSLSLTEQLRLILAPSLATKMRGDFRTGKRLNIKRIIPYIASGYRRDKIWMRRSVPSKRSYQVMLAVDDSKSMTESGSSKLAFETLALLSRSLSMLEVGQICVASFGEDFKIAHDFEQQFSTESAIKMFQHFSFNQTKTNVRNLMIKSLDTFREARTKQSTSSTDLWQLQLIISDGVCEDHESIRRLVRQAHEERIMIVFAVINSAGNHSILNMTQASFEPDENGETKLKIKRYLDGFPFSYYLIVGDIKNLPGVLSTALRQWFAEVVDSS